MANHARRQEKGGSRNGGALRAKPRIRSVRTHAASTEPSTISLDGQGTIADPFVIDGAPHTVTTVVGDTAKSSSSVLDAFPPALQDESGPEYVFTFTLSDRARVCAELRPEPEKAPGVDIDLHLLRSLSPLDLVARGDRLILETLGPGTYFLVVDSYRGRKGPFVLDVTFRPAQTDPKDTFNEYMLQAVRRLDQDFSGRGYDINSALTHDVRYGEVGVVKASNPPYTMCVAAVLEVVLEAMNLYAEATGDATCFDHLDRRSWQTYHDKHIRGHVWVDPEVFSFGTADAARHFGMGMNVPFKELTPGSVLNLNRTTGSGHAVVFIGFIDRQGGEAPQWDADVVGFKYFSSQPATRGLGYRYGVFARFPPPQVSPLDRGIIESADQEILNTGILYAPPYWRRTSWSDPSTPRRFANRRSNVATVARRVRKLFTEQG
jgi:hypothetical protein